MDETISCPLPPGLHFWIWPGGRGEGWRTPVDQAMRVVELGGDGVICQSGLSSPAWLQAKETGDSMTRFERLAAGYNGKPLIVTAGLGIDGSASTEQPIVSAITSVLRYLPLCRVMTDWESQRKWENEAGRTLAKNICADVLAAFPLAFQVCMDCPWWEPEMHSQAPNLIFRALFYYMFCQVYGTPAAGNPVEDTEWMLTHARNSYLKLGVSPDYVRPAEQMYGHTVTNAGRLLLSGEPVIALWDVEEMDVSFGQALLSRNWLIQNGLPPTKDGVKTFQQSAGLEVDGDIGPITCAKLGFTPEVVATKLRALGVRIDAHT